ncbi:membrane-spanning 4-domains subfamily A member 4D-like [Elgaria multicarinata webbii]|uniref:membrane-spanning 4-domains subfamily A member 4D-like n=1 Tax=Elgaria multicarinata webbii TaxID=159646 RepID=UPI002FCD23BD
MDSTPVFPQVFQPLMNDKMNLSKLRLKKFYEGEPLALGITQIFIGLIGIAFGLVMDHLEMFRTDYMDLTTPYWTGILYVISGSLAVAAAMKPRRPLVNGMLGMNVVSTVAAGIGMIVLSVSLGDYPRWYYINICEPLDGYSDDSCSEAQTYSYGAVYAILVFLLVLNILQFCITISTAAFGCKATCQNGYTNTVVVVYQNVTPGNAVSLPAACKDPEIP